jgi:signal transduction histidine kinase/CheY-like chemotaxis protein
MVTSSTSDSARSGRVQWQTAFSRRSDIEFRQLLEHLPAGAYTCDAEGLITYYNEYAAQVWGREPKLNDPVDRWCGSFKLLMRDGTPLKHADCWMGLAIREDRGYNGQEIVVERPDGSRITVLAHANPIHDDDGKVVAAVNVLVDIRDRKEAENKLLQANRAKNEFLAMLAHELRNPLAPMQNALRVMRIAPADTAAIDHARGVLERQMHHLGRVVDDLIDVSRITRNRLELRTERVDLGTIINQALETSRPLTDAMAHHLTVILPPDPIYLQADAVRLAQVFTNLVRNAAKYTEPKGEIRVAVERQGSDAVVSVRDNGMGIDARDLAIVFEMFTRADGARRTQGGLGIGLTLARRLVELHGGRIEARSDGLGHGSEFVVRLPIILDAPRPVRSPISGTRPVSARMLSILVVDDNEDAAESLAELLQLTGNETHIANDGASALEAAEKLRPDIIFLDIGLPRMDGHAVARAIRAEPWGARIRLVALTGWGQPEDRLRSDEAGFDRHLVKPVDFDVLERLIAETAERATVG